jgi:hypothetical protein
MGPDQATGKYRTKGSRSMTGVLFWSKALVCFCPLAAAVLLDVRAI